MEKELRRQYRFFLKDTIRKAIDFSKTDQDMGVESPPIEKPHSTDAVKVDLIKPENLQNIKGIDLAATIAKRKSRRKYTDEPLTMEEISFLLWATQGIRGEPSHGHALRTVPSAGCRHAFETYLTVFNIQGLKQGIYRYLPTTHQLLFESSPHNLRQKTTRAAFGQKFAGNSAVTFIWTAIPYRMEWRYGLAAYKVIAIDVGHVCQNLYLVCEGIGAGTCAIAAYDQEGADALLGVDGEDEFVVYMASVGKTI